MNFRIGNGYDVHKFAPDSGDAHIMLAGIAIPHTHGMLAHSDGDVLIHALCDALLGALALGDIGEHFPDTDPQYCNIASGKLLQHTCRLITERGWRLVNTDITVIAEAPRISPHKSAMRHSLAELLQIDTDCISIKATTTEGLGFTGRREGVAVHASVLLQQA